MKEQLLLLLEVQRHDARIQELNGMKKALPAKLDAMRADLKKVEAMLDRERAQLDESEAWRKRQESEAKDEESRLMAAKQRSSQVKNVKEMMASERELQASRKNAQEREEEVQKLAVAVEAAKKSIAQHEGDLEGLRAHVASEEAAANQRTGELDVEIAAEQKTRDAAAAKVRADVIKKYSTIRMKRGLALVPVKGGTCQGCNMSVAPQLFNVLQRGDSLEQCDNCHRLIYWDQLMVLNSDGEAGDKAAPKA